MSTNGGSGARGLGARLGRLERMTPAEGGGAVPVIVPDLWPPDVRADYDAARLAGDVDGLADVIERQTGQRPRFGGRGVSLIINHVPDGLG